MSEGPMSGKTCVITGATSGIGEVTALELARKGARMIVVGRSADRCAATVDRIQRETGATAIESIVADLSAHDEVRRLSAEIRSRCDRLDVLINNAGGMFLDRRETVDGIEWTFGLNHLSYFLLTEELLPMIKASAPARIVNVASDAHKGVAIDFDDIQGRERYSGWRAYQQSKLANILFTRELARRLEETEVTVNTLHPGFVRTRFFHDLHGWLGSAMRLMAPLLAISPEEGAKTTIHLASSPDVEGVTGEYFVKCRPARSSPQSHDQDAAARLWRLSEELTSQKAAQSAG